MALVSKILEATLTAGNTSVTFTDAAIPNSLIRVFSSDSNIIPESRILSGTSLTVVYAPQTSNIDVALEIVKQGLDIVDNVLSEDTDKALSAKQGYLLSAAIGDVDDGLSTLTETVNSLDIPDNITDLDDVNITSIQDGQVLAWDEDTSKFVNVDQSGGTSSLIYSTSEQLVGKWLNNEDLYKKSYISETIANGTTYIDSATNISVKLYEGVFRFRGTGNTLSLYSRDYDATYRAVLNSVGTDTTGLYLDCTIGSGRTGNLDAEVTVYYTKTS